MTWDAVDRNYYGHQIYVKERSTGVWIASVSRNPDPDAADVVAVPGGHILPAEYSTKDAAIGAAKTYVSKLPKTD